MKKRFFVFIDTESVIAEGEHASYQRIERFVPKPGRRDSGRRRGQRGRRMPQEFCPGRSYSPAIRARREAIQAARIRDGSQQHEAHLAA